MKLLRLRSFLALAVLLQAGNFAFAQTTITIGTGTSSSSTRGPFQRSDTNSTTVYTRFVQVYTASELSAAGMLSGASISQVKWELASSNIIVGTGNASMKIYVRNSTATKASSDTWTNLISGSSLVHDVNYNTTNNFPGANGWMPFNFNTPFAYTGGALEIAVDWDCSAVSTPVFSGNGEVKWRWASTAPDSLVVKKTSSSGPSSTITDVKNERANIQIVYSTASCNPPSSLHAATTATTANIGWTAATSAASYNWKIVAAGAGSTGTAVDSGATTTTMDVASGLTALTSYDLYVMSNCGTMGASGYVGPFSFMTIPTFQAAATIGAGTSSSSTRGPLQRSDTNSTTVFSRFVHVYTPAELTAAGIVNGTTITSVNWDLASSNVIIGAGDANLKVYIKNSTATAAAADTWANFITGSTLVVDNNYNTSFNFPGVDGWMPFNFNAPFTYTGGSIEIAVDWDCSQVSTPAFDGDGSIKWRWESTAPNTTVVKKTSSSGPAATISDLSTERANIQLVYPSSTPTCTMPTALTVAALTAFTADFTWDPSANAATSNWKVVAAGAGSSATAVDGGSTADSSATASGLMASTSYDLYVESDCGTMGTSGFAGPVNFTTMPFGIEQLELVNNLTISPNPTNGSAILQLDLERNAQVELAVYSVTGQLVERLFQENVNNLTFAMDFSLYRDGLYFVQVQVNGKATMKKIIVSK